MQDSTNDQPQAMPKVKFEDIFALAEKSNSSPELKTILRVVMASKQGNDQPQKMYELKTDATNQALRLAGEVDFAPEDKFRILMDVVLVQQDLYSLKRALEAAQNITDNRQKAFALLEVAREAKYIVDGEVNDV